MSNQSFQTQRNSLWKECFESLLMLSELFRLPYWHGTLVKLVQADVAIPDCTPLAEQGISLDVADRRGPNDVVVGSTGLQVFGKGE